MHADDAHIFFFPSFLKSFQRTSDNSLSHFNEDRRTIGTTFSSSLAIAADVSLCNNFWHPVLCGTRAVKSKKARANAQYAKYDGGGKTFAPVVCKLGFFFFTYIRFLASTFNRVYTRVMHIRRTLYSTRASTQVSPFYSARSSNQDRLRWGQIFANHQIHFRADPLFFQGEMKCTTTVLFRSPRCGQHRQEDIRTSLYCDFGHACSSRRWRRRRRRRRRR